MATAGRILIMPKGTWNAETTYENLDMVAHSGRAWLAKKVSVGIEPSDANAEFWHDFLGMDVFTEANPPTAAQVGAVSLYADPVLSKSTDWDNLESGTYRFSTWGGSGGVGYPPINDVGICILLDTEAGRYMYCLGMNRIVSRYYESKTWSDWIEGYLPLTGGTLSGSLAVERINGNTKGKTTLFPQNRTVNGKDASTIEFSIDGVSKAFLAFNETGIQLCNRTNNKDYNIFGEHNKPSGSYTGNGSATSRTINVDGVHGFPLLVMSSNGIAFVFNTCVVCVSETGTETLWNNATYQDGATTLTLTSTHKCLNANGDIYRYRVL